jgi:hypothetical protein
LASAKPERYHFSVIVDERRRPLCANSGAHALLSINAGASMKSFLVAVIVGLLFDSPVRAEVQMYTALLGGESTMSDTQTGTIYNHESQFFIGHLGGAFGGGYVFTNKVIGIGLKSEIAWTGHSMDRKTVGSTDSLGYRYETQRGLSGVSFSLRPGPMSIDFEYYPWILSQVSYSDKKSENPFRKNDKLKGTGFGVGFAFNLFPPMRNFMLFRRINYNNVQMNGVTKTLPDDQYSLLKFDEVVLGFGAEF